MCAKPDQSELRERAFAQLMAEALKPGRSTGAADAACPDAELVAAYADRGLADSERVELETHFAACERCQKILAALGVGLEAPVGEAVAVMPAPGAPHVAARPSSSSQRWIWWLTPAFGAAAAALLWMVLRPASPGGTAVIQTAANYSQPDEGPSRALVAQDTLSSRTAAPSAAPRRDAQALSKAKSAAKEDEPARKQAFVPPAQPRTEQSPASVPAMTNPPAPPQAAPAPASEQRPVAAAPPAAPPAARDEAVAANQQGSLQARSMAAVGAPAARPSTAAPAQADRGAAVEVNLYTFSPPDGSATWRLGIGGRIERSTDRGRTWEPQSSGVTTDLIAGSASSRDVAWVIGRGGVILRSVDGEHWERMTPPAGVTVEWAAIAAHNAMSATVVANDLRRFSTEDGGSTWTQQK